MALLTHSDDFSLFPIQIKSGEILRDSFRDLKHVRCSKSLFSSRFGCEGVGNVVNDSFFVFVVFNSKLLGVK